jgi:HK97 gp10 family phage protein
MVRFEVDGLAALTATLDGAATGAAPAARRTVTTQAQHLAARLRAHTPVRTGATRDSVTADPATGAGEITAEAGHTSPVARYLEYGTAHMAPRPMVEPAIAETLDPFEASIGEVHEHLW